MSKSKKFVTRALIISFWSFLIISFLLIPNLKNVFLEGKSINILVYPDMIEMKAIHEFEKKTGVKVNVNYYEGNDELFTKIDITKGKGYDLITITDIGVDLLRKKNLLKKINKNKLDFINKIDSHFLNHYFDPNSEYSLPYNWDIYGLAINLNHFDGKIPEDSWNLIFHDKYKDKKITMVDDAYDAILLAALHLYGNPDLISKEKLLEIEQLLISQKPRIEIYDTSRSDYFLTLGLCSIVVCQSIYVYRAMQEVKDIIFKIPKEGGFLLIDSFIIPEVSEKDEIVYELINFLYKDEQVKSLYKRSGFIPTITDILYSLDLHYLGGLDEVLNDEKFKKYYFLKRDVSPDHASALWINVKGH